MTGATADRPPTSEDRAATIALTVILGLTGAVLSFGVLLQQGGVAACSGAAACDYALLAATTWITPTVALAALVLSVVVLARRWRTRRRAWWVPVAGMLAAFAAFAVASSLVAAALQDVPR